MLGARVQVEIDPILSWIWQCFRQETHWGGIVMDQKYTDTIVLRERFVDNALSCLRCAQHLYPRRRMPRDQKQRFAPDNVKRVSPTKQEEPKFTLRLWLA